MNMNKVFPELHGDESLYETTRVTMENILQLLDIPYTTQDRRHAPLPSLDPMWSYMYNIFVRINGKKYSFLIGDFAGVVDERIVEVYPISGDAHRFYYTQFKQVLNTLIQGGDVLALIYKD